MAAMSSTDRYGSVAIAIHWVTAAAILVLLCLGFVAANTADPEVKAALLRWHVPLGLAVFLLTLFRIAWWWFIDRRPPGPAGPRWQSAAENAVRLLLYFAILLLGSSGIATVILSGAAGVLFFGAAGPLADFWEFPPMTAHLVGALALIALALVHIAAALYHHLFRHERLIARMGIGRATPA